MVPRPPLATETLYPGLRRFNAKCTKPGGIRKPIGNIIMTLQLLLLRYLRMRRKPKSFASLLIFITTRSASIHTARTMHATLWLRCEKRKIYINVCAAWHQQRHPAPKQPDQPFNALLFSRRANLFLRCGDLTTEMQSFQPKQDRNCLVARATAFFFFVRGAQTN